jgi:hypothetical protein
MNQKEKLLRDIETLRESVRHDWRDLSAVQLSQEDRAGIKKHIQCCLAELKELEKKLG